MSMIEYGAIFTGNASPFLMAKEQVTTGFQDVRQSAYEVSETTQQMAAISGRSFRRMIFGVQMGVFYFSMLDSAMMRQETTALTLADAQDSYNDAIREYGASSEEATRAARRLERVQHYVDMANRRAMLSFVGLGLQAVNMAVQFQSTFGTLDVLIGKLTAIQALSGPKGWIMLAGAVAAGVGAGYYFGTMAGGGGETNINVGGEVVIRGKDLDTALEEYKQAIKEEAERVQR